MINNILTVGYNIDSVIHRRCLMPNNILNKIHSGLGVAYSIDGAENKIYNFSYNLNSLLSRQNSILTAHYNINKEPTAPITITRKNYGD